MIQQPIGLYTTTLNFETKSEIGQEGRNSKVFLAHDKQLDGDIVVKQVPKTKIVNPQDYYSECKILFTSTHHNVVKVNYGCEDNDYIYLAMPYYKNGSLKKVIDQKYLTVRDVLRYSLQFLSGLHNIHSKGLIHFDVKPDNILLSDSDEALLADFGLAKAMNFDGLAKQQYAYQKQVPPEMFQNLNFSIQYDIYLAGLTIYRLINGNEIFNTQFMRAVNGDYRSAVLNGTFPDRNIYLLHVPASLRKVVNKCLSVRPEDRHGNVLELMNELSNIEDNLDWQYHGDATADKWSNNLGEKTIFLELSQNGSSFNLKAYKEMHGSGKVLKINDYCKEVAGTAVKSTLQKAFKSLV